LRIGNNSAVNRGVCGNRKRNIDMATQEKYHVGIDVDNYHQVEVRVDHADYESSDWVSAAEYAIELVQSQHPLAYVELAYVKEFCV
tara:strand:- start:168 stop:425 length:258 start_codon:yes stop_codon:yes gene_type:complete